MALASGWDSGRVFYNNTLASVSENNEELSRIVQDKFIAFLEHFRLESIFIYRYIVLDHPYRPWFREQIRRNLNLQNYLIRINLPHIQAFDDYLATQLSRRPLDIIPLFESAVGIVAKKMCVLSQEINIDESVPDFQVQIEASSSPIPIRDLDSTHIGKLIRISGIVVSTSTVLSKPSVVCIVCKGCRQERFITVMGGLNNFSLPRTCAGPPGEIDLHQPRCPMDPFSIVSEKTKCIDQQTIKLQESQEMVPIGEMPRQALLTVDRNLINKITPGSRISVTGIYCLNSGPNSVSKSFKAVAIRTPFIRVLSFKLESDANLSSKSDSFTNQDEMFTEQEEREMLNISRLPDFFESFTRSIAPSIYGNDDIKKAICCLLFGGSRKILPDRIRLRGDINVLLLGDPGVAKSQFLKFVEKVAPISLYTSGKGSSAAGLTASVVRDPASGEFYLEGGAMVLADGGVVCIDEFDKMNNEDRVAIHEAMEQQTISIAKAGITTILNSRTSVLAAANPIFGRYDEMKTPGENIDFSTTILSRFDMIFVVKDEHNSQKDITLARHVLSVHMNASSMDQAAGEFDIITMKRYISFCKSRCAPRLSPLAADKLSNHYVALRAQVQTIEQNSLERSSIPITVRQLEAIIRISEALAKMALSSWVTEVHVDEALRLFRVSTMQAVISGHSLEGMTRPDLIRDIDRVEKTISQRIPIGSSVSYRNLITDLIGSKKFSEHAVIRAIDVMVQQEKFVFRSQKKILIRQR